jgi:hypothetical protein
VSPVRPLDHGEDLEGQDVELASHRVVVTFEGVGLSGLEPLTSALSGQRSNRLSYRPAMGGARRGHEGQGYLILAAALKPVSGNAAPARTAAPHL